MKSGNHHPPRDELLAFLHERQRSNPQNYLRPADLVAAAERFALPVAAVRDAVTFYSMFSLKPRGRHVIRLCESPNCHLAGAWSVLEELRAQLGVGVGGTSPDGLFTLELTSCLGVCGVAPAMMIDEEIYGNLNPPRVREILQAYKEER